MFFPLYFRENQTESGAQVMTKFVADVRALANEVGYAQDRKIPVMARVWSRRDDNLDIGLDVESWIADGSVDYVVGQIPHSLLDTGVADGKWLADAANDAGASAYLRPGYRLSDLRAKTANSEMFRAFAHTIRDQGFAGMYLGYLPWPFAEAEYRLLREMAYPEMTARLNKRYFLPPREELQTYVRPDTRLLPIALEEGVTERIPISVADDVESATTGRRITRGRANPRLPAVLRRGRSRPELQRRISDNRPFQHLRTEPRSVLAPLAARRERRSERVKTSSKSGSRRRSRRQDSPAP